MVKMKTQKDRLKQYAKVVLIISCVFAAISFILFIIVAVDLPKAISGRQETRYLYENGVEVDANFKYYYDDYGRSSADPTLILFSGRFHLVYEYVDANGNTYIDEYSDTVECTTRDELRAREQDIKQMIATDAKTMKMLIADNGLCCLSVYKEDLISSKTLIIEISMLVISSVVLGLCIFGIVKQSKKLKRYYN